MVFVADVIQDELMRITEFLNEQMNPAQVFAVEVKQYRAEGYPGTVIVPAVYGRTAAASLKASGARRTPNRDEALAASKPETIQLLHLARELDAQRLSLRQVRLGHRYGDRVEVVSGLVAGERIATDPLAAAAALVASREPRP